VNFTLEQWQALESSTLAINEPFMKKKQSFRVIPLSDPSKKVGIVGNGKVQTLAVQRNSIDIPCEQGGQIGIMFPDKSKWHEIIDPRNWSLMEITVSELDNYGISGLT
jgi:hypothetical protein